MAGMPALFEPLRLGGIALANRNAVSPMCQYSAENGAANDWHLQHLGSLSLSGAGLVIVEQRQSNRRAVSVTVAKVLVLRRRSCSRCSPTIAGSSPNRSSLAMARTKVKADSRPLPDWYQSDRYRFNHPEHTFPVSAALVITRELSPDVPGAQPRIANLVKLNANESPFRPSPLALEAMRAAAVDMTARSPPGTPKSVTRPAW
jgi:hypothetical protein